jgi:hypothetical protein
VTGLKGLPRRLPGSIVQAATCERPLGCCHDQRLGVVEVSAEAVVEPILVVPQEVVVEGRADIRPAGRGLATGANAVHAFSPAREAQMFASKGAHCRTH